jgi:phage pi2 protein 07
MEELITYRVIFKETKETWIFQYRKSDKFIQNWFNSDKGTRIKKLFSNGQFPYNIEMMEAWTQFKELVTIELVLDDYSFESFWNKYDLKQKKEFAEKAFNKLSLVDKIKCFAKLPSYDAYVKAKGINKQLMVTWINQKRYNDEFKI